MSHTPTPWHTASDHTDYFRCIEKDDRLIAKIQTTDSLRDEADAEFVVRAVNAYDDHVKLLNLAVHRLQQAPGGFWDSLGAVERGWFRAAIAKAEKP